MKPHGVIEITSWHHIENDPADAHDLEIIMRSSTELSHIHATMTGAYIRKNEAAALAALENQQSQRIALLARRAEHKRGGINVTCNGRPLIGTLATMIELGNTARALANILKESANK